VQGIPYIAVCGPVRDVPADVLAAAEEVGARLAEAGAVTVCGGLGGVMEAAARGARSRRGTVVGLLPGTDRDEANGWVSVAVATGMGELRNGLIVRTSDAVVAVGRGYGTLSEIALGLKLRRRVVSLHSWDIDGVQLAGDAAAAVALALESAQS
jgi:hypothetical protein